MKYFVCIDHHKSIHLPLTSKIVTPYRRHIPSILHLTQDEKAAFATILSQLAKRYDNLFSCSFAYSMGIHQLPTPAASTNADVGCDDIHLHLHFYPPLLRSASVRKFLVGFVLDFLQLMSKMFMFKPRYEMLAEPQRDLTAEQAASRLRACDEEHYLDRVDTGT